VIRCDWEYRGIWRAQCGWGRTPKYCKVGTEDAPRMQKSLGSSQGPATPWRKRRADSQSSCHRLTGLRHFRAGLLDTPTHSEYASCTMDNKPCGGHNTQDHERDAFKQALTIYYTVGGRIVDAFAQVESGLIDRYYRRKKKYPDEIQAIGDEAQAAAQQELSRGERASRRHLFRGGKPLTPGGSRVMSKKAATSSSVVNPLDDGSGETAPVMSSLGCTFFSLHSHRG
jgi:hypothetical protein